MMLDNEYEEYLTRSKYEMFNHFYDYRECFLTIWLYTGMTMAQTQDTLLSLEEDAGGNKSKFMDFIVEMFDISKKVQECEKKNC